MDKYQTMLEASRQLSNWCAGTRQACLACLLRKVQLRGAKTSISWNRSRNVLFVASLRVRFWKDASKKAAGQKAIRLATFTGRFFLKKFLIRLLFEEMHHCAS